MYMYMEVVNVIIYYCTKFGTSRGHTQLSSWCKTETIDNFHFLGIHFEIQYGGHLVGISSGSNSRKMVNRIIYYSPKCGAFLTKRTIPPKKLAMPLHYLCGGRTKIIKSSWDHGKISHFPKLVVHNCSAVQSKDLNCLLGKLGYLKSHPVKVVSRHRDPQL